MDRIRNTNLSPTLRSNPESLQFWAYPENMPADEE